MIRGFRREDGNVLVIAMVTMVMMFTLGLAAMANVDTQTSVSRGERVRESSFNLAEAAMSAQTFLLGRLGTGNVGTQFPAQCPAVPASALCPDAQGIARSYAATPHPDFGASAPSWTTTVRDNTGGSFYDPSLVGSAPRYDANVDKQLWVKSTAVVRGKTRSIVALIRVEERPVAFPRYSISAGFFRTTNQGNKVIVDASGSLGVGVRCDLPPSSPSCLEYSTSKGQLSPAGAYTLG
ncbi:MAG: pilus assembly PilX family protein, partial [Pseudonocardiaceae bacterium]